MGLGTRNDPLYFGSDSEFSVKGTCVTTDVGHGSDPSMGRDGSSLGRGTV